MTYSQHWALYSLFMMYLAFCLTIFEAVCLCHITFILLCFLVAHASLGLLALLQPLRLHTQTLTIFTIACAHIVHYPVKVVNACTACARMMDTWTTYLHTYIHKYSDFLVVMISVGLASARPNYTCCNFSHRCTLNLIKSPNFNHTRHNNTCSKHQC